MRVRLSLASLGVLAVTLPALPADLPPPDKLPSRPEMPNPLVMLDGTRVTTKADWEAKRETDPKAVTQAAPHGRA